MNMRALTACLLVLCLIGAGADAAEPSLKALIIDGQNNHQWEKTTPVLKEILEGSGLFRVDVATTLPKGESMDGFKPDFAAYNVLVMNYNGDDWPAETQQALVDYMRNGGGMVVFHAANNSFPKWKEYNEMIGLGGWGGRNEESGPMIRWRDGKIVRDTSPAKAGMHGPAHEFQVEIIDPDHPIVAGLPRKWLHPADELYSRLRGPAENLTVLAVAWSDPARPNGTGEYEPMLFTITYGKGRVFHDALGHGPAQMRDVGFIVTLVRGTEWAATGKTTWTAVPPDFPGPDKISLRDLKTANDESAPLPKPKPAGATEAKKVSKAKRGAKAKAKSQ